MHQLPDTEMLHDSARSPVSEDDDDREIRRDLVNRVRRILTVLIAAPDMTGGGGTARLAHSP